VNYRKYVQFIIAQTGRRSVTLQRRASLASIREEITDDDVVDRCSSAPSAHTHMHANANRPADEYLNPQHCGYRNDVNPVSSLS